MNYNWNDTYLENFPLVSEEKQLKINLDIYRLFAFKKLLYFFSSSNTDWAYSSNGKNYLRIIINNISNIRLFKTDIFDRSIFSNFLTHIIIDTDTFDSVSVQTYLDAKITIDESLKTSCTEINNFIYECVSSLYRSALNSYSLKIIL